MQFKYIDAHCHPNLPGLKEEQGKVVSDMELESVLGIVVGTGLESSREAVKLAEQYEHLYATVGLHPNYTQKEEFDVSSFSELLKHKKVVGVGECGIDYFRGQQANERAQALAIPTQPTEASSAYFRQSTTQAGEESGEGWKEKQWEVFKQQVGLAVQHDKPLMIHCRPSKGSMDAYEEVATYLESFVQPPEVAQGKGHNGQCPDIDQMGGGRHVKGNMHFFVGDLAVAKRFWNLGFTTSFTGVLTFTKDYNKVVREAPADMILSETDAPWAAPVPHRGETNYPTYVRYVAEAIARIRGEPIKEVQKTLLLNAKRVFGVVI